MAIRNSQTRRWLAIGVCASAILATTIWLALDCPLLLAWISAFALVTFLFFGIDKARARAGLRRIPEATLLWLSGCGGSPGALLAMPLFAHKTQKVSFRLAFFAIVGAQILAWIAWQLLTARAP